MGVFYHYGQMLRRFWVWLFCLTDKEKDSIANLVLAKIDERQYKVEQLSPDKAKLIEYSNHPSLPGSLLVRYERDNGTSTHCVPIPAGKGAHEVLDYLRNHEVANKS